MNYEKKYKDALERAKEKYAMFDGMKQGDVLEDIFPELKEGEDERIRKAIHIYLDWLDGRKDYAPKGEYSIRDMIAWIEKQWSEPNWCHHKVDLSAYSEEYRKAYYDGWNNCNMQHSQCKLELDDVVKCLINGKSWTAFTTKAKGNDIEYTRTDAFIDKAAKWISEHTSLSKKLVIENFVNYMKGE